MSRPSPFPGSLNVNGFRQPRGGRWRLEMPRFDPGVPELPTFSWFTWSVLWGALVALPFLVGWHLTALIPLLGVVVPLLSGTLGSGTQAPHAAQNLSSLVSGIYSAGAVRFAGATVAACITSAITAAASEGAWAVLVPRWINVLGTPTATQGYTGVTFNTAVRMLWEGADWGVFDLRAYGGAINGTADDSTPWTEAIKGAMAVNGTVQQPLGTSRATNVQFTTGTSATRVRISGQGHGSIVKLKDSVATNIFMVTVIGGITFENLTLDGNVAGAASGINCVRVDVPDAHFRHVRFINSKDEGVFATPGSAAQTSRFTVVGCQFVDCGRYGIAAERTTNIVITGNVAEGCGAGLVDIEPTDAGDISQDITITGNTVRTTGAALVVAGAIQLYATNAGFASVVNAVIANNVIQTTGGHGIRVGDCKQVVCTGNVIISAGRHGIYFSATTGNQFCTIVGNTVKSCGTSGTNTYDGINCEVLRDSIVAGNTIGDESANHRYHLRLESTCLRVTVGPNRYASSAQTAKLSINVAAGTTNDIYVQEGHGQVSSDRGDADVTLQALRDPETERFATTLTANRTVTLSATDVFPGARFRIVRSGLGAFSLDVGGLKTIPASTAAEIEVEHDGSAWRLVSYAVSNLQDANKDFDHTVVAGGFRQTIDGWVQDNVAASQTNAELTRATGRFRATRSGSITAVIATVSEARTAGTLTVEVYKNTGLAGAAGAGVGLTAVLDGTNTSRKTSLQAQNLDTFGSGDELYAVVTTDAGWLPVTSDLRVAIEIET